MKLSSTKTTDHIEMFGEMKWSRAELGFGGWSRKTTGIFRMFDQTFLFFRQFNATNLLFETGFFTL